MTLLLPARYTRPLSDHFPTDGDKLIELARVAWLQPGEQTLVLDTWQEWLLRHILERYPDDHPTYPGRLRYRQVVISVPRQVGKSLLAGVLGGVYGFLMHVPAPSILSLASSVAQASIIYDRVLYTIRNNPLMAKRFKRATETRGIVTADGSGKYQVKPASEAALQGIPITLCLFDELHLAKTGMWSAAVMGTQAQQDGIVIGITTAGDQQSSTLLELYKLGERAVAGDPELERFGFFVWEAPAGMAVDSPEAIRSANPAVACGRIPLDDVLANVRTMPDHEARRYVLNQFVSGVSASWLPADLFASAGQSGIENIDGSVLAVDRSANWAHVTIAAAKKLGEHFQTELVASMVAPTENQVFTEIMRLLETGHVKAVGMDEQMMPSLAKRLKDRGVKLYSLWTKEVAGACALAYASFASGLVTHGGDPLLAAQVGNGVPKYSGDKWLISRKDSYGEVDALMATILAMYVAHLQGDNTVQVF